MSAKKLTGVLQSIGSPRLLVVGDLILDEYVWGEVDRISPEAPIPVLRVERREQRPGGAGSVVVNLGALGVEVHVLSVVGQDQAGDDLLGFLDRAGCDCRLVYRVPDRITTTKVRHLGFVQHADRAVQQLLRVDSEVRDPLADHHVRALLERAAGTLGAFDAILVSDYDKGFVTGPLIEGLRRLAGAVPVLADPARLTSYERYRGATLVCPNRYETALATGMSCGSAAECARAGQRLARAGGFQYVAVTMDRDGICLCTPEGEPQHFETEARTVADVTGAGDMVLSILGLIIGGGGNLADAMRLANVAAGIEIRLIGSTPISREEIQKEVVYRGHTGSEKLKRLDELVPIIDRLRRQSKTTVFTNGCFDLLHFGHHHLLNQAKRLGDCLVVAVNSDASIRKIKGPRRPFTLEQERMLMLSGLECVDYVVLFDDETPIPLLEALRPEVLVKGAEYREGLVVGRDLVESYGGRVELVDEVPGISTTAILERGAGAARRDP